MDNIHFSKFLNFTDIIFSTLLDPQDKLSLYSAKKILNSSTFIYNNITKYLSETNATKAIFISVNFSNIIYQYMFATWFMYLLTTMSGLKKILKFIFQNPLLGIFFYVSFYFRLLGETDKSKFDNIAEILNIPKHADFTSRDFLKNFINSILEKIDCNITYKTVLTDILQLVPNLIIAKKIENLPEIFEQKLPEMKNLKNTAVYISNTSVETEAEIQEWEEYVLTNFSKLKKQANKAGKKRKIKLQQIIEKKTEDGKIICLDTCKQRIKTTMGCYCESDCGPSFFLGKTNWCFVDSRKCKKGKALQKYMGKTYDTCDPTKISTPKCFSGIKYKDC